MSEYPSFKTLLVDLIERPDARADIERQIKRLFSIEKAIMVVDLCGFTRTARVHGILPFLVMIHHMQELARPIAIKNGGQVLEARADDLLCLFPTADEALVTAREIIRRLASTEVVLEQPFRVEASIGIGYGTLLQIGHDRVAGYELNVAAKLGEDIAGGGEILLTASAVAHLAAPPAGVKRRSAMLGGTEVPFYALPST